MINFKTFSIWFVLLIAACEPSVKSIIETPDGYQINKDTSLTVILQTPMSSNINQRGDTFKAVLKSPLALKDKIILPETTEIRGLVKRVVKFENLGDRASLLLIFDQIVLPDGRKIPLESHLDTEKGSEAIKIKGKKAQDIGIVGGSAIIGTLVGKQTLGKEGAKKGLVVGTTAGIGAVFLSDMMEIKLPEKTELTIKLKEPLIIPKN